MSSDYDPSEFVDGDLEASRSPNPSAAPRGGPVRRAPSREEVDSRVADAQQKLAELKRAQEELERERASLEETRRRQIEFQTGRQEMLQNLTRGLGLLESAELEHRREAEKMAKTLADFRQAIDKIQAIREETWTKDTFQVELTRGLTALENARMEWNAARLKFDVLSAPPPRESEPGAGPAAAGTPAAPVLGGQSFGELCRLGFALTWPVAFAVLVVGAVFLVLLLRR